MEDELSGLVAVENGERRNTDCNKALTNSGGPRMQLADLMEGSLGEPYPDRPRQHAIVANLWWGVLIHQ